MNLHTAFPAQGARRAAVVGAGIAGLSAARRLADAGWALTVFEREAAAGGRLASGRIGAAAPDGTPRQVPYERGCPGFTARSEAFRAFLDDAQTAGAAARWQPRLAEDSFASLDMAPLWVGRPEMSALARHLLQRAATPIELRTRQGVDTLARTVEGWTLRLDGGGVAGPFDAVVIATTPGAASPLLMPWRDDWALAAARRPLRPCWTLAGLVEHGDGAPAWDLARPVRGPIATLVREDTQPGRAPADGAVPWVVHASADWSHAHADETPESASAQLQAAAAEWLGSRATWRHAVAQLWREASASRAEAAPARPFLRDDALGLAVCGDHLGGAGVEGAWRSGHALAEALLGDGTAPH